MDEASSSSCNAGNEAEMSNKDNGIPKVNMKFDGHSWTNQSNVSLNDVEMDQVPSTSRSSDACEDLHSTPSNQQTSPTSNDDTDGEFELTADAMIHDYDDEGTLDEEEAGDDGDSEELDDLTKEGEMPLSDLLAMYYNRNDEQSNTDEKSPSTEKESSTNDEDGKSPKNDENDESDESEELTRKLRSSTSFLSPTRADSGDDDVDGDYVPPAPEDWKKSPRVGMDYQVDAIPDTEQQDPDYDVTADQLIWDPSELGEEKVETFLTTVGGNPTCETNSLVLPTGSHLRDNEDALFLLTQCNNDVDEAIRRYKWRPTPLTSELHVWSEEECRQFEHGLSLYGKDFHVIHHNKVKTKSIGEIVKFYYIWKKSDRYDNFNAKTRLGKKKETIHPGVTDYMERLLDETEHSVASQHNNHTNSATTSYCAPHSHSAALQQQLVDLRVTRRQHRQHHPQNTYEADSPTNDYSEMNGLLDGDYVDDIDMFDNIVPTLSANHMYPSVPFASIDPGISVSYSDPGQFVPISTTAHRQDTVAVGPATANSNNNCHVGIPADSTTDTYTEKHGFRPLDPAEITPAFESVSSTGLTRTTPLPPDVLSSIDELETVYCSPSNSNMSPQIEQTLPIDPSADSPSETRDEVTSVNLKRFQCSDINDNVTNAEVKRKKVEEDSTTSSTDSKSDNFSRVQSSHESVTSDPGPNSSQQDKHAELPSPTVNFQPSNQTELPHESISDAPRIVSC